MTEMHWLSELEEKIATATSQLKELRKKNSALERKVKKLETRLASSEGKGAVAGEWDKERKLIRKRVQRLADNLEALLEDDNQG